ncbi:ABC-2 type transport system ATP-binding protein [Allochromatium warmingii]|uniref:ABC-2 type transport system ATP-binding protein n=1 Tax=Allochromatium warmingii TaxID=61595 RepID=A0A1H3EQU9_ALLWA|nr:ATP-binding cassette domain-containing protein [Allochromatium warmingii]SDX81126.1 ABC-2 type transport system ATP-binding protein [Allochromatium warmingii]
MDTLVRATALSRQFGQHSALSDVELCLERGQVLGLLGANGAGKTTCLRLLSGLLAPTAGRIEILGIDLVRQPLAAKRHLGYLPERPPLYPELRVDEYLTYCARLQRLPRRAIAEAVATAKQRCGLDEHGRRLIATLSRGYRQRLGLAQAILHRPAVLILDEPTEGLDPVQMRELRGLIRELAQDAGIILSSHLLPEVQAVCDRVMILHQGRVRLDAAIQTSRPTNRWRVQLGEPLAVEALKLLAPVAEAQALGSNRFQIELCEGTNSADLARALLLAELDLCELAPERSDLERTFFDLIGAEEQHG